jgi:hypothetical protein
MTYLSQRIAQELQAVNLVWLSGVSGIFYIFDRKN